MNEERSVIRYISWRDLFPWLVILQTFRLAIQPTLLALATAATLVTPIGWWVGSQVFLTAHERQALGLARGQLPVVGPREVLLAHLPRAASDYLPKAETGLIEPFLRLAEPVARIFRLEASLGETAYCVFGTLWTLAIWALAGGFITRYAVIRLGTEREPDALPTLRFAARRYLWYLLTPLYPLLGVVLIAAPIAFLGLLIWLSPGAGSILVGMLWIFVVAASLAAAWLLAGLIFGWPLMWPAISAERDGDPFEAFSRTFSYVYGQPLRYFFYVIVAALLGALGYAVVQGAATLVTEFGFWALSWGGGGKQVGEIRALVEQVLLGMDLSQHPNRTLVFGSSIFALVVGLVRIVVTAYSYSFFWCAASAIYLLLRMDADEQEMDEVFLDEPRPQQAAAGTAAQGAPVTTDLPSESATAGGERGASAMGERGASAP